MADTNQNTAAQTAQQTQGASQTGAAAQGGANSQASQQTQGTQGAGQETPAIDYEKIQKMLDGTLQAKEGTALKAYFKQQGLTEEQVAEAIRQFKEKQAEHTPNIGAMNQQLKDATEQVAAANRAALEAQIKLKAYDMANDLSIELATMPYVLKLADLSAVTDDKGNIKEESLKEALTKVLADLPQLKKQDPATTGFRQIGADGKQATKLKSTQAVPEKRWNRFNT